MHDWIIEGLPPKVLLHHQRMLGIDPENESETVDDSVKTIKSTNTRRPNQQRS